MLTDISLTLTPAVAVLQDTSRFLLTLGVGLFLAYIVLIISANVVGVLHRLIATVLGRSDSTTLSSRHAVGAQQVSVAEGSRVLERETL